MEVLATTTDSKLLTFTLLPAPPSSVAFEKTGCVSYFVSRILYLCFLLTVSLGLRASGVSSFICARAADVS